eukprot:78964-Pyramimonas_sp.AAC.1
MHALPTHSKPRPRLRLVTSSQAQSESVTICGQFECRRRYRLEHLFRVVAKGVQRGRHVLPAVP